MCEVKDKKESLVITNLQWETQDLGQPLERVQISVPVPRL